jgi:hypothetical protein
VTENLTASALLAAVLAARAVVRDAIRLSPYNTDVLDAAYAVYEAALDAAIDEALVTYDGGKES